LKPSFNKSGQSYRSTPFEGASKAAEAASEQQGRTMTSMTSASLSSPAHHAPSRPFGEIRAFWRQFVARAFDPYRPELHYMRGPGPAWRAKHTTPSHRHSS
jgi:hypothetical protein